VLLETDAYIRDFIVRSGMNEPIATSEFHYRLGCDLMERFPGCEEHSVVARAALTGVPIYTSSPGDSSIGMNIAYHELMNGGRLMIDPNKDVNEVCAIVLAGARNGCVILGGGSPKNFYLQAQPTLWEVYGIPKGGNEYFIQITTDSVVWGGLSGATPAEAVSWGKVNPGWRSSSGARSSRWTATISTTDAFRQAKGAASSSSTRRTSSSSPCCSSELTGISSVTMPPSRCPWPAASCR